MQGHVVDGLYRLPSPVPMRHGTNETFCTAWLVTTATPNTQSMSDVFESVFVV